MVEIIFLRGDTMAIYLDYEKMIAFGPIVHTNAPNSALERARKFKEWFETTYFAKFNTVDSSVLKYYYQEFLDEQIAK